MDCTVMDPSIDAKLKLPSTRCIDFNVDYDCYWSACRILDDMKKTTSSPCME